MRYTRLEIPKNTNSSFYRLIFEFLIIIPIVATIFGSLLTRFLIIPYFNSNISAGNASGNVTKKLISAPVIIGKEYSLSVLQAGVYLNRNNAENLVKSINSKGQNAFFVQDGDSFRIILEISEDKKILQQQQLTLMSDGYKSIINSYKVYSKSQDGQNDKRINEYLYDVAGLIKLEFQYKEALSEGKDINLEQIKSVIASTETGYKKIMDSEIAKEKLDELTKYHGELIKLSNEIIGSKDLKEVLPRLTSQIIQTDKLSNSGIQ